jgi:hypothetical protein
VKHGLNQRLRNLLSSRRNRIALGAAVALGAAAAGGGVALSTTTPQPETGGADRVAVADLQPITAGGAGADAQTAAPGTTAPGTAATVAPTQTATDEPSPAKPTEPSAEAKESPARTSSAKAKESSDAAEPAPPASKQLDYTFQAQTTYYYCGPAATRIALTVRDAPLSQDELARRLGTTVNGTNSAADTTRVLNSVTGSDFYRTVAIPGQSATPAQIDRLQADVVRAISKGYAVVANIAGSATDTAGGWHSYPGGHYLTVVGYRDGGRTVKIADPAIPGADSHYWMTTTSLAHWIATRGYSA